LYYSDLELAFVIDSSLSMADDMQGVIDGLVDISQSLQAVRNSGRAVKIGIVLFGKRPFEHVALDFTSDMNVVETKLKQILEEYIAGKKSTQDPGEDCYHGLCKTAEGLSWRSSNRMAVVITDEPANELCEVYDQGLKNENIACVNRAEQLLKAAGIQTSVYTIVTKN